MTQYQYNINKKGEKCGTLPERQLYVRYVSFASFLKSLIENKLTTTWLEKDKSSKIAHKTQHWKLKIEQQEPYKNLGVISCAPEG